MRRAALAWGFVALGLMAAPAFAADTVYYYSSDTLHSEVVVTDQSRNVVERTHYAPYGQVLNRDLRDGPGYTGHEEDPETNLVYMQQRYYDPEAGRFLSVDPVAADGGGGSFNRYEYAEDNPYTFDDPFGEAATQATGRVADQGKQCSTGSHICGTSTGALPLSITPVDGSYRKGADTQSKPAQQPSITYKHGVPPGSPAVHGLLMCTAECMGQSIRVTSTSESTPVHGAEDVHTRGLAADITTSNPRALMQCAANCGAVFQLNEYAHPSRNATAGHVHIQLVPGRHGGTGPYYPQTSSGGDLNPTQEGHQP